MERHDVVAELAPRVHQRIVERVELVHLAHRILEGRDVQDLAAPAFRLGTTFGGGCANGPARPSSRARSPRSQRSTRLESRLQHHEAEAIAGAHDVPAVPALHDRLDALAGLPRRTRQPAGEEHVVLRLEPLQLGCQGLQVVLDVCELGHAEATGAPGAQEIRNHINGSHSSRAYGTGRSSISTSLASSRPTISKRVRSRTASAG